jgi:hypothetical protein
MTRSSVTKSVIRSRLDIITWINRVTAMIFSGLSLRNFYAHHPDPSQACSSEVSVDHQGDSLCQLHDPIALCLEADHHMA